MSELFPVIRGRMGGRDYYLGKMTFQELAAKVQLFSEIEGNPSLESRLQREIKNRSRDMTQYLKRQSERFYGAVIVATWGGRPEYVRVRMEDHPLLDDDFEFGLLKLNGRADFFALDGQHRLESIRTAIKEMPELRHEEVSVLFVTHERSEAGNVRTRRLFHTLNRYAKPTTTGENVVLDEDNVVAICTRRLLDCGIGVLDQERVGIERKNVLKSEGGLFTSLAALFGFHQRVLEPIYRFKADKDYLKFRPSASDVENVFGALRGLWGEIEARIEEISAVQRDRIEPGDFRAPQGDPGRGHLLFRPLGLELFGDILAGLLAQEEGVQVERCSAVGRDVFGEVIERALQLPLVLGEAPWRGTILRGNKIRTSESRMARRLALHMLDVAREDEERLREDYRKYQEDEDAALPEKVGQ